MFYICFLKDNERDFKASNEHWQLVINFMELYPELIKNKFNSKDSDKIHINKKWQELAENLNALGYGNKTVEKWQLVNELEVVVLRLLLINDVLFYRL